MKTTSRLYRNFWIVVHTLSRDFASESARGICPLQDIHRMVRKSPFWSCGYELKTFAISGIEGQPQRPIILPTFCNSNTPLKHLHYHGISIPNICPHISQFHHFTLNSLECIRIVLFSYLDLRPELGTILDSVIGGAKLRNLKFVEIDLVKGHEQYRDRLISRLYPTLYTNGLLWFRVYERGKACE